MYKEMKRGGWMRADAGSNIPKETPFSCIEFKKEQTSNKSIRGNIKNLERTPGYTGNKSS